MKVQPVPTLGFFESQEPQSIVKSQIVTKYFQAWSKIMLGRAPIGSHISYVDLFSGPGRFADGSLSTPLLLLSYAIETPALHDRLIAVFNDMNKEFVEQLNVEIQSLPGIKKLKNPPRLSVAEVGTTIAETLGRSNLVPTLFFIDPFGYKGLTRELIGNAIRSWGCECVFFFNYNRINPAINNLGVDPLINDLFGKARAERLRQLVVGKPPSEREDVILEELIGALGDVGGKYVLLFEFARDKSDRPSHHIVFVTKQFRGYDIMKEIMAGLSTDDSNVKALKYVRTRSPQMALFEDIEREHSIRALKDILAVACAGQSLTTEEIYMKNSVGTPYTSKNVKEAILELESEGRALVDKPADKRIRKGKVTLGDDRKVTFPA